MKASVSFIDLFAGIGGMRIAFESIKGVHARCVFSSEWDKFAAFTYELNFGEAPAGDIKTFDIAKIKKHDILLAGFPCQPFSISGVSKKQSLGRPHGFEDAKQGNLFFDIVRILKFHQPKAFLLENVKNLKAHDKGRTFAVIMETLVNKLGYDVSYKVLDAINYVPQHRERIYIVGFRKPTPFKFPIFLPPQKPKLKDILQQEVGDEYTLTDHLWQYLQNYAAKHREQGNGFGYGLADLNGHTRTLSARYHKDGSEILIPQKGRNPRRLTPRECARLMGYKDAFKIEVSDTQAYRQFGNSVVVPLVHDVARSIVGALIRKNLFAKTELSSYNFISGNSYEPHLFSSDADLLVKEYQQYQQQ